MSEIAMKITGDDKNAQAALARLEAKVLSLQSKIQGMGRAGQESGDNMSTGILGALAGYVTLGAAVATVQKALSAVDESTRIWMENMKEAVGVADKLIPALKPLLSGGGRKAMEETMKIVAAAGIAETARYAAYAMADAIGDAMGGDTAGANRELKEVLDVFRLGDISMEGIQDIATRAAGFGKDVGQTVRQVHVLSQRFRIAPETFSKVFASMEKSGDIEQAMALTARIGSLYEQKHGTVSRHVGAILELLAPQQEGAPNQNTLRRKLGITRNEGVVDFVERMEKRGLKSMADFTRAGVKEQDMAFDLSLMTSASLREKLTELQQVTEDTIIGQIAKMKEETPEVGAHEARMVGETIKEELQVFGPSSKEQNETDRRLLATGLARREMGMEKGPFWPFNADLIDKEGRATTGFFPEVSAMLLGGQAPTKNQSDYVMRPGWYEEEIERTKPSIGHFGDSPPSQFETLYVRYLERLNSAAEGLENATRNMSGGPAMVPRGEDK